MLTLVKKAQAPMCTGVCRVHLEGSAVCFLRLLPIHFPRSLAGRRGHPRFFVLLLRQFHHQLASFFLPLGRKLFRRGLWSPWPKGPERVSQGAVVFGGFRFLLYEALGHRDRGALASRTNVQLNIVVSHFLG